MLKKGIKHKFHFQTISLSLSLPQFQCIKKFNHLITLTYRQPLNMIKNIIEWNRHYFKHIDLSVQFLVGKDVFLTLCIHSILNAYIIDPLVLPFDLYKWKKISIKNTYKKSLYIYSNEYWAYYQDLVEFTVKPKKDS